MLKVIKHYPFSLLCIILIWILCFEPTNDLPSVSFSYIDKIVHFCMYLGTCSTIWWEDLRYKGKMSFWHILCWAFIVPVAMSGLIECLQAQTTYRGGDFYDFLFNTLGASAAFMVGYFILTPIYTHND